jgi:hypothetical protein
MAQSSSLLSGPILVRSGKSPGNELRAVIFGYSRFAAVAKKLTEAALYESMDYKFF